jgi:uncharacterized protein (DUF1330 family)
MPRGGMRIILIEFDTAEQVERCFGSAEYLALAPLREQSTTSRAIIVDGYSSIDLYTSEEQTK